MFNFKNTTIVGFFFLLLPDDKQQTIGSQQFLEVNVGEKNVFDHFHGALLRRRETFMEPAEKKTNRVLTPQWRRIDLLNQEGKGSSHRGKTKRVGGKKRNKVGQELPQILDVFSADSSYDQKHRGLYIYILGEVYVYMSGRQLVLWMISDAKLPLSSN